MDACWGSSSDPSPILSKLKYVDPTSSSLSQFARKLGYKVDERDFNELKDDKYLTIQADDDSDIRLNIGSQDWYVCQAFLLDESYEAEDTNYSSLLVQINLDGSLELDSQVVDELCLGDDSGAYLVFEKDNPINPDLVMSLYSDTMQAPPTGGHDEYLKLTNTRTLFIDSHIIHRVGLHAGDLVSIEISSGFDAYIYRCS